MSLSDNVGQGVSSITKPRRLPVIGMALTGAVMSLIMMYVMFYSGNTHKKKP